MCSIFLQEGEDTCILMWAKSLSVSILRRGRWEEHDLTPATFGKDVGPKLHGSSCDRTKARYLRPSGLVSGPGGRLKQLFWSFRLVLNYQEVLGHSNFKLM